jgi:energy-converting hydrogenase Eha subunit A
MILLLAVALGAMAGVTGIALALADPTAQRPAPTRHLWALSAGVLGLIALSCNVIALVILIIGESA